MPALYDVLATYTVIEFHPPDRQAKMLEWVAVSKPSGVQFYFRLPNDQFFAAGVKAASNQLATLFNTKSEVPGVSSIVVNQIIDQNNQVDYSVDVTVVSDNGNYFQTITIAWNDVWTDVFDKQVAATLKQLNDLSEE